MTSAGTVDETAPPPPGLVRSRMRMVAYLCAAAVVGLVLVGPIGQDPAYHDFADRRPLLGIPNCCDVLSNAPFLVVGAAGLAAASSRRRGAFSEPWERVGWAMAFTGLLLTAFGSAWYHFAPDNGTLFWDRLPMTLFFMPFFALTLAERVAMKVGRLSLGPLVLLGVASVFWWDRTEAAGAGDLRAYAIVQFVPMLAIPLMLLLLPGRYTRRRDVFLACGWYLVAKGMEALDTQVFALGGIVSGHTLKHLAAAVAPAFLVRHLWLREPTRRRGSPSPAK